MDLTYISPIRCNFIPKIGSTIIFEFRLKSSKNRIKVNVDVNIFYKDPLVVGRVSLVNSGVQSVYASPEDTFHIMEFKIPKFQILTQSYVHLSMEPAGNFYDKVIIDETKILELEDTAYSHPNAAIAIPNLGPKIGNIEKTKILELEVVDTAYSHPNTAMAIPNLGPKIGNIQDIKDIVTRGYRDILKEKQIQAV